MTAPKGGAELWGAQVSVMVPESGSPPLSWAWDTSYSPWRCED